MLDTVTESLAKILQHIWRALFTIDDVLMSSFTKTLVTLAGEAVAEPISKFALKILHGLSLDDTMAPEIKSQITAMLNEGSLGNVVTALVYFVPWLMAYTKENFAIINQDALRQIMTTSTPSIPDIHHLIQVLWRHPDLKSEIDKMFGWLGFDKTNQDYINKAVKPVLDKNELMELLHRDEIKPEEYNKGMLALGYTEGETAKIMSLGNIIPNVSDLVRMAVREVFTPEVVERFGQNEGFPTEFAEFAKKQGLSPEWAKRFWAAHWELPSIMMGYEMLHRKIIEPSDLDMLMKAQDVMPFWRDKLKQISYRPYTRVDVRRMHKMGVLEDDDLLTAYTDLGYDDEKAENMKKFTIAYNEGVEKDLSKSEILDCLKKHLISEKEVMERLQEIGYDSSETQLLIDRALYEKSNEEKSLTIAYIKSMFMNGVYSDSEALQELGKLNVSGKQQDDLMELWRKLRKIEYTPLTSKELLAIWQAGIISDMEWREEMKHLHYTVKSIDWLYLLYKEQPKKGA